MQLTSKMDYVSFLKYPYPHNSQATLHPETWMWFLSWPLQSSWDWCPGHELGPYIWAVFWFAATDHYVFSLPGLTGALLKPWGIFWSEYTFSECLPWAEGMQASGASLLLSASTPKLSGHCGNPLALLSPIAHHWVCPSKLATWEDHHYPSISAYKCKPRLTKTL